MPKTFIVTPLQRPRIDQALPILLATRPGVNPAAWRAEAERFLAPEGAAAGESGAPATERGIFACHAGTGHIRGLFCYARSWDRRGSALAVRSLVAAGLFDGLATAAALLEAAEGLARRLGCRDLRIDTESGGVSALNAPSGLADLLRPRGYRVEGTQAVLAVDVSTGIGPVAGTA